VISFQSSTVGMKTKPNQAKEESKQANKQRKKAPSGEKSPPPPRQQVYRVCFSPLGQNSNILNENNTNVKDVTTTTTTVVSNGHISVLGTGYVSRFHDMFVHSSGLRRAQGTKNETLTLRDPEGELVGFTHVHVRNIHIRHFRLH